MERGPTVKVIKVLTAADLRAQRDEARARIAVAQAQVATAQREIVRTMTDAGAHGNRINHAVSQLKLIANALSDE
jgi:hypothetical protein